MSSDGNLVIRSDKGPFCFFCKKNTSERGTFNNTREDPTWIYMPANSTACIECYIHECVRKSLEELNE